MIRCASLGDMRANLMALGHQYLSSHVCDLFIRQAVDEFVGDHPWPWRLVYEESRSGTQLADIDIVDQVASSDGRTLEFADRDWLADRYGESSFAGEGPSRYWFRGRDDFIWSFPQDPGDLKIRYFSRYGWIDAAEEIRRPKPLQDSDTPVAPNRCDEIILLGARVRAKGEAQDFEQAAALREQYETRVEEERSRPDQVDEFRTIRITAGDWA